MASLIIHGDLSDPGPAVSSPLHVHPVMVPCDFPEGVEGIPTDRLFVDVIHAAFQRLFGGSRPVAPSVRIVNISLGDPARVFTRRLSPLARLLDYLAYKHNVLIVVSAGNCDIAPTVVSDVLDDPQALDQAVRQSLHAQARHRRLLSPAESINALTVGALHADASSTGTLPDTVVDPLIEGAVAVYSPSGSGFRRSPKPDLFVPGGRSLYLRPVIQNGPVTLEQTRSEVIGPGVLVASPSHPAGTSGVHYSTGTSNSAALTTREAHLVLDVLEAIAKPEGSAFPDGQYHPVLIKTLLVHACSWPDKARKEWGAQFNATPHNRRRLLTQHLGFGVLNLGRVVTGSTNRVTLIGAGSIENGKRHSFRMPLPPSLSDIVGWRRLTVTLAWLSPIVPTTQQYRVAHLELGSPRRDLKVVPIEADRYMNGKGTVRHEVLEGKRAAGYTRDAELAIDVDCRVRVGRLDHPVRFGLAATLEIGPDLRVDIYQEILDRLRQRVRVAG